jgi:hypothetical protein
VFLYVSLLGDSGVTARTTGHGTDLKIMAV